MITQQLYGKIKYYEFNICISSLDSLLFHTLGWNPFYYEVLWIWYEVVKGALKEAKLCSVLFPRWTRISVFSLTLDPDPAYRIRVTSGYTVEPSWTRPFCILSLNNLRVQMPCICCANLKTYVLAQLIFYCKFFYKY